MAVQSSAVRARVFPDEAHAEAMPWHLRNSFDLQVQLSFRLHYVALGGAVDHSI
jgi:hypothetical protein